MLKLVSRQHSAALGSGDRRKVRYREPEAETSKRSTGLSETRGMTPVGFVGIVDDHLSGLFVSSAAFCASGASLDSRCTRPSRMAMSDASSRCRSRKVVAHGEHMVMMVRSWAFGHFPPSASSQKARWL